MHEFTQLNLVIQFHLILFHLNSKSKTTPLQKHKANMFLAKFYNLNKYFSIIFLPSIICNIIHCIHVNQLIFCYKKYKFNLIKHLIKL